MSRKLRVHVMYEYSPDLNAQCSGHIRMLRPLSHPSVADRVELTGGRHFDGKSYDVVVVERLMRETITLPEARALVAAIRHSGAKLVYTQDDNMFDLSAGLANQEWMNERHYSVMKLFQQESVGLLVSTERLKARLSEFHARIEVVHNALDERLLSSVPPLNADDDDPSRPVVVGFMGTRSHDEDLQMIAPALRAAHARFGKRLALEIVGGLAHERATAKALGLPVRALSINGSQAEDYPLFMPWFTSTVRWDVGLAPLRDNAYNACKSDIKWLDYSAIGAAGIYSAVEPYRGVEHGVTGIVAQNEPDAWRDALMSLLEDRPRRVEIAQRARRRLFASRTLRTCATRWVDALETLLS